MPNTETITWQPEVQEFLLAGNYHKVANFYEQAIENESHVVAHYWHLGLSYLLQSYEEEAQTTWLLGMSQIEEEEADRRAAEFSQILDAEARRQTNLNNYQTAWAVRQHLKEIDPHQVNNILHLLLLSFNLNIFEWGLVKDWQVIEILEQSSSEEVDFELILQVLTKILEFRTEETLAFLQSCLPHVRDPKAFNASVMPIAVKISSQYHQPAFAAKIAEVCLDLQPSNSGVLHDLSCFYTNSGEHQKGISTAKEFYKNCQTIERKILGNYLILRAIFSAGSWLEAEEYIQRQESLMLQMIQEPPEKLDRGSNISLLISPFFLPYLQDDLQKNRWFRNQVSQLFQNNLRSLAPASLNFARSTPATQSRPLKIGYIAHTLRSHSVGWLSRWLFQHHDREAFPTTLYCVNQNLEDKFTQNWFRDRVDVTYSLPPDYRTIAGQIHQDEIDILVDLDSITLECTCEVMAMKPAPVQVTWLGWDASGLPAIDHYIADPYVLPENAQEYYQENIWRLPQTYLAVDGFEVGIPTLRREDLEIPSAAIVYLSAQTGYKRHPDTVRLQMQIIKEVPNSYFLIKGLADNLKTQEFFTHMAEEVGVDLQRLKFLPRDLNEFTHRANLTIADVILDTFPYNGATTTLETLWMGVPLVTKVGQQFAARNSYTFMMNAGITEGIAWTDEEYIEWGARLGKDEALRHHVAGKLKASRQTSPLWNAKQFTREMEKAYQQMWQRYLDAGK
ncbi:MAG: O-linked N-acetylglucosamine transferase, SPINDLY family protein [Cyanosarcina radialis HA8281-LM2]|jgi:predicted O-linked N-acetylglucosamine transferase (SPINDLY family)|nr:O-linked N-acetylglucosamine transferase, SPINDLY family protein [Cyanosarcina radialis HA8281-LM2]